MKREYQKPISEELIVNADELMDGGGYITTSPGDDNYANTGNFELDEEVGDKPASFSLWDENGN